MLDYLPEAIDSTCVHFDLAALFRISGHSEDTFGMVALAQQQFVLLRQSFVARRTICEEQRAETTRIFGLHLLEGICFFNAKLALWKIPPYEQQNCVRMNDQTHVKQRSLYSMYGIFTYIGMVSGVSVGKYSIHGALNV